MKLSPDDVHLFYKLYTALLRFANDRYRVIDSITTAEQLMALPPGERYQLREALFEHPELIDEFVSHNPDTLSADELAIVAGWKHYVKGTFYLLRQLKKYAIFLSSEKAPKAYGVLALADSFDAMLPFMPVIADTVLLPFKGQIIYDGLISSQNVYFGGSIKRRFNNDYNEAKARYGIITTLPYQPQENTDSDSERLKFYVRSERNREYYWDEIQRLIRKNERNKITYYQAIGKAFAKQKAKRLRELGITRGYFGIVENIIVGSGVNKKAALANIETIVPKEKIGYVYLFQLKAKK